MNAIKLAAQCDIRRQPTARVAAAMAAMTLAAVAHAQYAVDPRAQTFAQPTGQIFDANPQLYGGRYNTAARPMSPLLSGNAYATGNVGRGLSLRSFSPISDPTSFQAPLGSGTLFAFRRDSISSGDARNPSALYGSFAQPYYDPSTTAYTAGYLQARQTPYAAVPGASPIDPRTSGRLDPTRPQFGAYSSPVRPPIESAADAATASSLFGPLNVPRPPLSQDTIASLERGTAVARGERGTPFDWPTGGVPSPTAGITAGPIDTSINQVLGGEAMRFGAAARPTAPLPRIPTGETAALKPGLILPAAPTAGESPLTPPTPTDPSVLPGYDTFTDMRLALALEPNPGATWFEEMQRAASGVPELVDTSAKSSSKTAAEFMSGMLNTPLKTLAGRGASPVNDQMLKAESLMAIGHFAEAADRYQTAHSFDPTNPLPLLGRGHALLAGGEYRSAAAALIAGLERYPDIARFNFELSSLMGGGENVDVRRADLMRRLAERDSPELRFLLGYLDYHAGDRERGLANLDAAARLDRTGSIMSRYPAILRGEQKPLLPRLESGDPDLTINPPPATAPADEPAPAP